MIKKASLLFVMVLMAQITVQFAIAAPAIDVVEEYSYNTLADGDTFYCEYCGRGFSSIEKLSKGLCDRHPLGSFKGNHYCAGNHFLCKYCGKEFNTLKSLSKESCKISPDGHHELYEGSAKSEYSCEYCGIKEDSIKSLTRGLCPNHPDGMFNGRHSPAP